MDTLTIEAESNLIIPEEISRNSGLQPGDEVPLRDATDGLFLFIEDLEARAEAKEWWESMSEEDRRLAQKEVEWYESISEEERDAIWNEGDAELEKWLEEEDEDDEGDEFDVPTITRPVG
jgi:bifunctional DNA-binding transcriptional regulator/antitoxin component of YhaV-PrlF toxin-antitoxin module